MEDQLAIMSTFCEQVSREAEHIFYTENVSSFVLDNMQLQAPNGNNVYDLQRIRCRGMSGTVSQ